MSTRGGCYLRALRSSQKLSRIIFNRRTPANEIRGERAWRREVYYLIYSCAYVRLRYANKIPARDARDTRGFLPPEESRQHFCDLSFYYKMLLVNHVLLQ